MVVEVARQDVEADRFVVGVGRGYGAACSVGLHGASGEGALHGDSGEEVTRRVRLARRLVRSLT